MKTLLIVFLMAACWVDTQACQSPPENFSNSVTVDNGTTRTVLATDRASYVVGDPVHFFLSWTNLSSSAQTYSSPDSPIELIALVPVSCSTPFSAACSDAAIYLHPSVIFFSGTGFTLQPVECRSWQRTWDGQPVEDYAVPQPGAYRVFGGLWHPINDPSMNNMEIFEPVGGASITIALEDAVPNIPVTWSQIKARYE